MTPATAPHGTGRVLGYCGTGQYPTPLSLARPAISNKNRTYLVRAFSCWTARTGKSENAPRRGTDEYPSTPETGGGR